MTHWICVIEKKRLGISKIDRLQIDEIKSDLYSYYHSVRGGVNYRDRIKYLNDRNIAYSDSSFYLDSLRYNNLSIESRRLSRLLMVYSMVMLIV